MSGFCLSTFPFCRSLLDDSVTFSCAINSTCSSVLVISLHVDVQRLFAGLHFEILLRETKLSTENSLGGNNPSWCAWETAYEFQDISSAGR